MHAKNDVKQQKTPHRWKRGETGNPKGRPRKPESAEGALVTARAYDKVKLMQAKWIQIN